MLSYSRKISQLHIDFRQGMDNPRLLLNSLNELRGTKSSRTARNLSRRSVRAQPETSSVNHNAEIHINESLTLYRKCILVES